MSIRIVTDSTCDLPEQLLRENHITVIPMYINVGSQSYRDRVDLSREEFYERLPKFEHAPTTAAPGPEFFRQIYEQLASEGATEILSIHISHKLSAVMDIATQAAEETRFIPVTAFDSRQLSLGTGFLALTAAQAAAAGKTMTEILALLEKQIGRTHVFAALDTLEFLRRSGRMNFALSLFGSLLQVKPLLKMYNGDPTAERTRTRNGAIWLLIERLREASPFEKVAIVHSRAFNRAKDLFWQVKHLLPAESILVEEINPVLGAHIGPGVLGFACITKE
jgi:DegV family protein with EDD domain